MKTAGGILVYKKHGDEYVVLLAHPGGPFWEKKDTWSIPKGEVETGEDELMAAEREFEEELGFKSPDGDYHFLGEAKEKGPKVNHIWAVEGDVDISQFICESMVHMEWPPKSGKQIEFPENDRIKWFTFGQAKAKVFKGQQIFFDRLAEKLGVKIEEMTDKITQTVQDDDPQQRLL